DAGGSGDVGLGGEGDAVLVPLVVVADRVAVSVIGHDVGREDVGGQRVGRGDGHAGDHRRRVLHRDRGAGHGRTVDETVVGRHVEIETASCRAGVYSAVVERALGLT